MSRVSKKKTNVSKLQFVTAAKKCARVSAGALLMRGLGPNLDQGNCGGGLKTFQIIFTSCMYIQR